jgi:L,D-peptidoglycan transpeptidase YkuD (ErfK/YbiS/YcfS/YnhG family)
MIDSISDLLLLPVKLLILPFLMLGFMFDSAGTNTNNGVEIKVNCTQNYKCEAKLWSKKWPVNIGQSGLTNNKIEGDGKTPIGTFQLSNKIYYRADKITFAKKNEYLKYIPIKENFGWCDDSKSKKYNQLIDIRKNKSCKSFENLYRSDNLYDIIIPIEYNVNPAIPGKGSAIFIHLQKDFDKSTAGCISFEKKDLIKLIEELGRKNEIIISNHFKVNKKIGLSNKLKQ